MKICASCKNTKQLSEFNINKAKKDGLQSICKDCNKTQLSLRYKSNQKLYIAKNRERIDRIKNSITKIKEVGCQLCSENDVGCIDFHHIDSQDKEFGINQLVANGSIKLLKIEIAKCCLLCSNCHRKLHYHNQSHQLCTIDQTLIDDSFAQFA